MFPSSLRRSDRKAAQILGVTLTRDNVTNTPTRLTSLRHVFKKALRHKRIPSDGLASFRWDVPAVAHIQVPLQSEIVRKSIVPGAQDPFGDREDVFDFGDDTTPLNGWHEDRVDAEDDTDIEDTDIEDGDDTDMADEDRSYDSENTLASIALPRPLAIPVRFIPSPTLSEHTSADNEEEEKADYLGAPAPPPNLAHVYKDMVEEEERAVRRVRRDEYRSRQKILAVLGREASSAL